jgi:hypothetical protein
VQLSRLDHLAGAATSVNPWLMALWPARLEFGLSLLTSQNPVNPLWGVRAQEGGGLSFRSACYHPAIPPLIDPYPKNWALPGSAVALWGKKHTFIIGRGETL